MAEQPNILSYETPIKAGEFRIERIEGGVRIVMPPMPIWEVVWYVVYHVLYWAILLSFLMLLAVLCRTLSGRILFGLLTIGAAVVALITSFNMFAQFRRPRLIEATPDGLLTLNVPDLGHHKHWKLGAIGDVFVQEGSSLWLLSSPARLRVRFVQPHFWAEATIMHYHDVRAMAQMRDVLHEALWPVTENADVQTYPPR
jgi:hypothetical protein